MGEFWPEYLAEHRNPVNRALHVTGTVLATGLLVAGVVLWDWRLLVAAPLAGYGFAWVGHFVVEKNRPKTFDAPLKSLAGDFRMAGLALCGRLPAEMKRHGVGDTSPHPNPPPLRRGGNSVASSPPLRSGGGVRGGGE